MRVSVFGLGYVGAVSAACLASRGHQVIGVDSSALKVELINDGKSPVVEKGLGDLVHQAVRSGTLWATTDFLSAINESDCTLVCVGTPSKPNGDLDLTHVATVAKEIGGALRQKDRRHIVVIRSTVLPGTIRELVSPLLERSSQKRAGTDFGLAHNPEFLREGTALDDFDHPPKTVIGATDAQTAEMIASLYSGIDAPLIMTTIETSEMVKYADNVWHALKVVFANEMGAICKASAVDSHEVMNIFCRDVKLNISSQYLRPGFAFGGSCLPKDVRALSYRARTLDLELPILNAIMPSNHSQTDRAFDLIRSQEKRRVSFFGMSFKAGTDDMRESPLLELIERLIGKGFDIRVYDRNVSIAKLVGANRNFLLKTVPHVSSLLVDTVEDAVAHGEIIVFGNSDVALENLVSRLRPDHIVIDLVRVPQLQALGANYVGINW